MKHALFHTHAPVLVTLCETQPKAKVDLEAALVVRSLRRACLDSMIWVGLWKIFSLTLSLLAECTLLEHQACVEEILWPDILPWFMATNATVSPALCYEGQLSPVTNSIRSHEAYFRAEGWSNPTNSLLLGYSNNCTPLCPEILWLSGFATSSLSYDLSENPAVARGKKECFALVWTLVTNMWMTGSVQHSKKGMGKGLRAVLLQSLQNAAPFHPKFNLN